MTSHRELIERVEAYLAYADACDVVGTLSTLARDCVLESGATF